MNLRHSWANQRGGAKRRGVPFLLTFEEWLAIWTASGHLAERGRCSGCYVMARHGDAGAYVVGNVAIVPVETNLIDAGRGRVQSAETRAKRSASLKGRTITWGAKIAAANKGNLKLNYWQGKHLSEAHKRAISETKRANG